MLKIEATVRAIEPIDEYLLEQARHRLGTLTKPKGSLGVLEEIAVKVVGITGRVNPKIMNPFIVIAAGDHGVFEEGVSAYPQEVTRQMVLNFLRGGAAINVLARHVGAGVVVVDAGMSGAVEQPGLLLRRAGDGTKNMANGPAMSREQAVVCIENGIDVVETLADRGADIIGAGEMGIANTTAASAIVSVLTGAAAADVTGRGTGIDDEVLARKIAVIRRAIAVNRPDVADGIDVLAKVGGFEIGILAGVFLGGAARRIPVVIDGFISGAAALIAYAIEPKVGHYLFASHCSVEKGHKLTLDFMHLKPVLNLDMRLGEGTGAALGMNLIQAAVKILTEMATFAGAGVAGAMA